MLGVIGALISAASGAITSFPVAFLWTGLLFGAAFGWPLMLVFGLPAHFLLYRRKSHRIGGYLLAGVLAGFLAAAVVALLGWIGGGGLLLGFDIAAGGMLTLLLVIGSVAASSLFWLIRRPDRDVLPPATLAAMFE